jgi:3,4-dihydroxy 2-butanone 4-phosphate synthase/GTP cyclohydrolase II
MTEHASAWRVEETAFSSSFGSFRLQGYDLADGKSHAVVIAGDPTRVRQPLVRLQSSCLTGTALGALLCDCRQQTEESLRRISHEGVGIVLYLDQEGRGHGLAEKVRQLSLITSGVADTSTAAGPDRDVDMRDYTGALAILESLLSKRDIRLLTNNPLKIDAVTRAGWSVSREAIEIAPTPDNVDYLHVKKTRMGHLLDLV